MKLLGENHRNVWVFCLGWLWSGTLVAAADPEIPVAPAVVQLTPYRIQLVLAFAPSPGLSAKLRQEIGDDLIARAQALMGAAWEVRSAAAPFDLAYAMTADLEGVTWEALPKAFHEGDKVILLAVAMHRNRYRLSAREWDLRTRMPGATVVSEVWQTAKLRDVAFSVVRKAFAPVARIDGLLRDRARLRLQAGAIPVRDKALALGRVGDVFRPLVVETRQGALVCADPIRSTYLVVERVSPQKLDCRVEAAVQVQVGPYYHSTLEPMALAVVASSKPTSLMLRSGNDPPQPAVGCDVYAAVDNAVPEWLGRTDHRGALTVEPGGSPLRILWIHAGDEVLARLPMVTGYERELAFQVPAPGAWLEVELMIRQAENRLVDLAVRRETLLAMSSSRLQAKDYPEAQRLLAEVRALPGHEEILRSLKADRKRITSRDPQILQRVESWLVQASATAAKTFDPVSAKKLAQDIDRALNPERYRPPPDPHRVFELPPPDKDGPVVVKPVAPSEDKPAPPAMKKNPGKSSKTMLPARALPFGR